MFEGAARIIQPRVTNPVVSRTFTSQLDAPLPSPEDITAARDFVISAPFLSCVEDLSTCDVNNLVREDAPGVGSNPLLDSFYGEVILRSADKPPTLDSATRLAEEIMGNTFDASDPEDLSEVIPALTSGLGDALAGVNALEVQEPEPAIEVEGSADAAYPYVKVAHELAPSGMEKFSPTVPNPKANIYNTGLLNTNGIIYLRQYLTDSTETGLIFRFQYAPQDISWQRSAQLETDPTWGTNVQPKHFTMTSGKKLNLGNILIDGMTVGNIVTDSVRAMEILMSINEKAPVAQVSPYCYKVVIGDRTMSDPFTGRHIPFVITSLQIKEEAYTPEGEILTATASLSLEEVPFYQVNDGRKLMLLFEDATSEDQDNCANLAADMERRSRALQEGASRWGEETVPENWANWVDSDQNVQFMADCESFNEDRTSLEELHNQIREQECTDIPSVAAGISAYNSLWSSEGFFGQAAGTASSSEDTIARQRQLGGANTGSIGASLIAPLFGGRNTLRDTQATSQIMGSCVNVDEPPPVEILQSRVTAQDAMNRIAAGESCRNIFVDNGYSAVRSPTSRLRTAVDGNAAALTVPRLQESEGACLAAADYGFARTQDQLSAVTDPHQRRLLESQIQQENRPIIDQMNSRYDELLEQSNGSFATLDEDACRANDNCRLWTQYGETMTQLAENTNNNTYLDDLRGLSSEGEETTNE